MRKKVLKSALAAALIVTMSLSGVAPVTAAESSKAVGQNLENQTDGAMQELHFSDEEVKETKIPQNRVNVKDRQPEKKVQVEKGISLHRKERAVTTNTDPNYALGVQNDMVSQGFISSQGERRWYGFELQQRSKITIFLQMVESLDADIELYSLDQENATLNLIGYSATEGLGVTEAAVAALDAGVYYFAVDGYEGTGDFLFKYYESSADANYEVNDAQTTATEVRLGTDMKGVIDSPLDVDYYKLTIDEPKIMENAITTKDGYSLVLTATSGDEAAIYPGYNGTEFTKLMPGTYYFGVYSPEGKYSATSTYTVRFREVGAMAEDEDAKVICYSSEGGIIFQSNADGSVSYVNGAKIDINYSFYRYLTNNPAGSQKYDLAIDHRSDVCAVTKSGQEFSPSVVYYHHSSRPAMNVGSKPVLMVTYVSNKNFYKIHVSCSGAYRDNNLWEDLNVVTVLVDPDTGKLIDIYTFNYYYDYIGNGNEILVLSPFKTTFAK